MASVAFWKTKSLQEMSTQEWESLCDGCALCCLQKLEDADSGDIFYTRLACSMLDLDKCQCTDYAAREVKMPDCVKLTPAGIKDFHWLPKSCAYRRLSEGRDLADWHPLNSGTQQSVVDAGVSVKGKVISNHLVPQDDWEEHIIHWVDQ